MEIRYYMLAVVIAVLGMVGGVNLTRKLGVLDRPGPDVPKRKPVPTVQGVVAILVTLGLSLMYHYGMGVPFFSGSFIGLRAGLACIVGIVFIDELGKIIHKRLSIPARLRLVTQLVAVACAFFLSGVGLTEFEIGGYLIPFGPLTSLVLTVGWFLLFTNAINWFDGIYGLATGMSSIGFLTIFLLLLLVVIPYYGNISPEKLGLLHGVIRYSRIFFVVTFIGTIIEFRPIGVMRDVGTMAFGFALAYLALLGGAKIGTLIVVLILPLFDAIWVIIDRVFRKKKNPMKGDFSHLHHRLMALNWTRTEVRFFIRGVSLFLVVLMLLQGADRLGKVIIFLLTALIFFGVNRYLFRKKGLPSEYIRDKRHKKPIEKTY